jgi:hypothetical protein
VAALTSTEVDCPNVDPYQQRTRSRTIISSSWKNTSTRRENQSAKLPVIEVVMGGFRPASEYLGRVVVTGMARLHSSVIVDE